MEVLPTGAAYEFLAKEYGGSLDFKMTFPATAAAFASIVGTDPDAVGLIIINNGANPVFISLVNATGASTGIFLAANGGSVTMNVRDDFILPALEWFASSPAGASALTVLRIRRFSRDAQ
jgi:hypothetical protein